MAKPTPRSRAAARQETSTAHSAAFTLTPRPPTEPCSARRHRRPTCRTQCAQHGTQRGAQPPPPGPTAALPGTAALNARCRPCCDTAARTARLDPARPALPLTRNDSRRALRASRALPLTPERRRKQREQGCGVGRGGGERGSERGVPRAEVELGPTRGVPLVGGAAARRGRAAPPARRVGGRRLRGVAPGSRVCPALGVGSAGMERRGGEGEDGCC